MGWLDWLFGEEEEESNPEFLVLGAKLKCIYGSTNSYLYVDTDNMNINNLPEACVSDSEARYNILPFGQCVMGGPCSAMMKIEEEWYNPKPQTKEVNGKEAITTDSTLVCAATGMLIEAVSSGQDGVFANQLLLMQEMDVLYPGLRELLEDPYGSLYLKDGMYELGIRFLQDRMEANGGSIEIFAMDTQNSLEACYITAAFERLLPYVDTRAPGSFFDGLQTVICKAGVENGADAHLLNAALIEVLQADCGDYAKKVSDGGYYKYQEENKMFLNWLGETSMSMAYGVMVYQSMVNWKPGPRNVYEAKEEVSEASEAESEINEGGVNEGSSATSRPTWRQSELDAATDFPDYDAQKSFINGEEVPYGTKGSVRPDYYKYGNSVDIKNYNVENANGRNNLVRNIEKQYYQRIENLPEGTKQSVMVDIRGQNISDTDLSALYDDIMGRTDNGVEILFKMD